MAGRYNKCIKLLGLEPESGMSLTERWQLVFLISVVIQVRSPLTFRMNMRK